MKYKLNANICKFYANKVTINYVNYTLKRGHHVTSVFLCDAMFGFCGGIISFTSSKRKKIFRHYRYIDLLKADDAWLCSLDRYRVVQ